MARPKKENKTELDDALEDQKSNFLSLLDNEYASFAEDGIQAADVAGFYDTGSYSLNALLSGSIYGGLPSNKITALAGESGVGKTYYMLQIVREFLIQKPNGIAFMFESESAITKQMLLERQIDAKRVLIIPVSTIQEFRTQAVKILNNYLEQKESDRVPLFFGLDSLGNLSTTKEMEDIAKGKDTRDMTRAQLIRGAFRTITLKLGKAGVPLVCTNHTYAVVGCATEKMAVKMSDGTVKHVNEIKVGDFVKTLAGDKEVVELYQYDAGFYYEVTLENGEILELTGEHKVLTQELEWRRVDCLKENDIIISF